MANYAVAGEKGTTSVRGILVANNTATTPRRLRVYEYQVGCVTTPADAIFQQQLARYTADPTATAQVPETLDEGDEADPGFDGFDAVTADGAGIGNVLWTMGLHHRASFRWVANPGKELIAPATDNNGIGGLLSSASTSDFAAAMHIEV